MKKSVLVFSIADERNKPFAKMMENSLLKFHPDIDYHLVEGEELQNYLKIDPQFYYKATPIIAEKYIKDYDLVLKMDADQIVTGSLDYIFDTKDYDVACVLNYNASDVQQYGYVQGWGISPIEYVNCGFVAMRSEAFVHEWKVWCESPQFDRMQYKEQDGLNIKVWHGNWNVRILDHGDGPANMHAFWGLFAKSFWNRAVMKDGKLIIPKDENEPVLSKFDTELKVLHWAGGNNNPEKMQFRTRFNEEVINYLDSLIISDEK